MSITPAFSWELDKYHQPLNKEAPLAALLEIRHSEGISEDMIQLFHHLEETDLSKATMTETAWHTYGVLCRTFYPRFPKISDEVRRALTMGKVPSASFFAIGIENMSMVRMHKNHLLALSRKLRLELESDPGKDQFELKIAPPDESIDAFLRYFYRGKVDIDANNAVALLNISEEYFVEDIKNVRPV